MDVWVVLEVDGRDWVHPEEQLHLWGLVELWGQELKQSEQSGAPSGEGT